MKTLKALYHSERMVVRFAATLFANLARAVLSFGSGILTARGLGASHYGDLAFLLASFGAVCQLTDLGSANAFFTFISRRTRSLKFFAFYTAWLLFQFFGTVAVIAWILPGFMVERIWVGHDRGIVLVALVATFFSSDAWGMLSQMGEARRKTVVVQTAAVLQSSLHLALIAAAAYLHLLTVKTVLLFIAAEYAFLLAVYGRRLFVMNLQAENGPQETIKSIIREFISYCKPMVPYVFVGFAYTFADRWLLQEFGGSTQQGFYAMAQTFANVAAIVTNSILQVFWKEFAEAHEQKNQERMRFLHDSTSRYLYFVCAWIGCLLIPYAHQILILTVGQSFEAASLCLAIMFFYPIHQSLGQIYSTALYASRETKAYAKLGITVMLTSIVVTYFALAPRSGVIPGLQMGALGLALKMVVMQVISVNWQGWLIARINRWTFNGLFQIVVVAVLLVIGWTGKIFATLLSGFLTILRGGLAPMILGGVFYTGASFLILVRFPSLLGLRRSDAERLVNSISKLARGIPPVA